MIYSEPEYNKMDEIEFRRKALQDSLDAGKTKKERNILGQFSTPFPLACDIMPWLADKSSPNEIDRLLATHIIGDRVCSSLSDPIIRNEQERRQLNSIAKYLTDKGYRFVESKSIEDFRKMDKGSFSFHLNVPITMDKTQIVNMPIDAVIMRQASKKGDYPVLIECKSAGDFTNTNKRRKEEATKTNN